MASNIWGGAMYPSRLHSIPYDEWPQEQKEWWVNKTTWRSQDGKAYDIEDMSRHHLENAMLYLFTKGYDVPHAMYAALKVRDAEAKEYFENLPPHIKQAQTEE